MEAVRALPVQPSYPGLWANAALVEAPSAEAARLNSLTPVAEQPLHRALGLTDGELSRICDLLGREPNHFELAVFSLLWSEHCGYKHSAPLLKRLPSSGERVLQGPGENAGVIDVGDGLAVAFKVESHNHPSAVEPFQGAATGVGGIVRDIVAMGARPIALLDGLRFGAPDWHFRRAVAGIGHYGNCVGVATVGGETVFDEAYAAAGLSSSLAEMARGAGIDLHLDRVPLREPDLEAWEIMISESQERMVAVVAPERFDEVQAACARWELPCTAVGEVTDSGEL